MADQIVNLTIEYSDVFKIPLQDAIKIVLYLVLEA